MANVNSAFGLRPVRYLGGAPYNGACNTYIAPASYATDLFIGDPVIVTGTASPGTSGGAYQEVNLASAGSTNQLTGAIVGFGPTPSIVDNGYGLASTLREVYVADDPTLLFEIQEDSDGNAIELAEVGLNCNLIAAAGNTYSKKSGWMLDSTSAASGATLQTTIRGFSDRVDNTAASDFAKVLVSINIHTNRPAAVAGV